MALHAHDQGSQKTVNTWWVNVGGQWHFKSSG